MALGQQQLTKKQKQTIAICDQMLRLQKVQNHTAKVVFRKSRHEHVRPLLKVYHWLPVKERIIFKMATFVFHFFASTLPPYCHHVFLCTFFFGLSVPVQMEKQQQQ